MVKQSGSVKGVSMAANGSPVDIWQGSDRCFASQVVSVQWLSRLLRPQEGGLRWIPLDGILRDAQGKREIGLALYQPTDNGIVLVNTDTMSATDSKTPHKYFLYNANMLDVVRY